MRVRIRGAGVAGLTLAHELVTRGAEVTVVERRERIAGNASWQAGGMLAPWCERESAEAAVLTLGRGAADWWQAALPGHVVRNGTLVLAPARDATELERFTRRTDGWTAVDDETIAALEPDLTGRFRHGLHFAGEAHLDPRKALTSLQARLTAAGVRFEFGHGAVHLHETPDVEADCTGMGTALPGLRAGPSHMTYDATFAGAVPPPLTPPHKGEGDFAAALPSKILDDWYPADMQASPPPPCGEGLGVGVPSYAMAPDLRGVRGEMLLLRCPDITLSRPVRLLHPRFPIYVVPRADHYFMVGATMVETDAAGPVTARSMMELLNAAYAVHPAFGEATIVETGVGIRPAYPDNFPRVVRHGRSVSINGLYRHGFLLAPAMARQAADMILGERTERAA